MSVNNIRLNNLVKLIIIAATVALLSENCPSESFANTQIPIPDTAIPDHIILAQAFNTKPRIKWRFDHPSPVGDIVESNGTIFYGDYEGLVTAVNASSGSKKWTFEYGGGSPVTYMVAGSGVVVFAPKGANTVICLNASDGRKLWSVKSSAKIFSNLSITDASLFFLALDSFIYEIDLTSGKIKKRRKISTEVSSSATIVDSNMYFGATVNGRDYLCAVDLNSEKQKWRMPLPGSVTSPIDVVVDNGLFLCSEKILCFTDLNNGRILKTININEPVISIAMSRGIGFLGGFESIEAYNLSSGNHLWSFANNGVRYSRPVISSNVLITTGSDGLVYGIDMKWGKLLWSVAIQQDKMLTDPVYVNGIIYLGIGGEHESEGSIIAIEPNTSAELENKILLGMSY